MPYREFVPEPIRKEIASWGLSSELHRLLWETAEVEIRSRAESTMRHIVAPIRCYILPISVIDPTTNEERTFIFYLDMWIRTGERTVISVLDADAPYKEVESSCDLDKPTYE